DWHLLELVADRLWLVANGTARPFEGDLEDYERLVLDGSGGRTARSPDPGRGTRRAARRVAAERRRELEPLRQTARHAEETHSRLTQERQALDRVLSGHEVAKGRGPVVSEALKRRAELVRLIEQAEVEWLAAEEAIERQSDA
ncbi:MAG: ABC transporter ATP-binding protein, partial [Alphaproteobacteria bacterium]|nr:ABC transporter ATP-binding protein [Alphaproteobacteria bacterium]